MDALCPQMHRPLTRHNLFLKGSYEPFFIAYILIVSPWPYNFCMLFFALFPRFFVDKKRFFLCNTPIERFKRINMKKFLHRGFTNNAPLCFVNICMCFNEEPLLYIGNHRNVPVPCDDITILRRPLCCTEWVGSVPCGCINPRIREATQEAGAYN